MIPGDGYAALAEALGRRGVELLVTPERYRTAHELPGWYATFADLTPMSVWRPTKPGEAVAADDLAALAASLPPGAGIVKDYVKSRKHEWEQACFLPDLADTESLAPAVRRLGCRFVTTDVALRADGEWRVVEVGDGQVSDLHESSSRAELAAPLVGSRD